MGTKFDPLLGQLRTTDTSNSAKLPTLVVAASGGDYTDIQSALNALAATGGTIYLTDPSYTITSTLLYKGSYAEIIGNAHGTKIQCDGSSVTTLIKSNSTTYKQVALRNVLLQQTNATAQGIGLDASNLALSVFENIEINGFGTAIKLNDTANNTFYNAFRDIKIFSGNNGIDITSTNAVNDNQFQNIRIALQAGGAGTGLIMTNGLNNVFTNLDVEPATGTGITGISLTTSNVKDTVFVGLYAENNATNVSIGSGVNRTTFIGGSITSPITTNISDSGTQTAFIATDDNGAVRNNPGALSGTLVTNDITVRTGSSLRAATTATNTLLLSAFNTGSSTYIPYFTLTSGNPPTAVLANGVVATTQTAGDNSTKLATTAYVDNAASSAGIARSVNSVSTNTSAGATVKTDYVYLVSGATTITLPTAVGNTNLYTVKNVGANNVTIATTSAQTIDGSATATLPVANTSLDFISNGSNWNII